MKQNIKFLAFLPLIIGISSCNSTTNPTPNPGDGKDPEPAEQRVLGGNDAGWEDHSALQGYYLQTEFTDEEWEEARALYQFHPNSDVSCIAFNELVLRNNDYAKRDAAPYQYEPGQRYELTKHFRDNQIGLYFWASFYGTYTFEGNQVTLNTPEKFSYCFDGGAGRPGASVVSSSAGWIDESNEENPAQDWIKGDVINSFNGGILNYRHNSGHEPMVITVDTEYYTFTINELDDDGNPIPIEDVPHRVVDEDFNYNGNNAGWTDESRTVGQGYYTQTDFTDEEWEAARSLYQMHPNSDRACVAFNELVLRNNDYVERDAAPYQYEPGQRYELTRQFKDNQIGLNFWATFYGTYTIEGDNVHLNEPERFSYIFDCGAGKPKASMISSCLWYDDGTNVDNPTQDWIKGQVINSFNENIINYRHNAGHEGMDLKIDQTNFKFSVIDKEE